MSNTPPVLPVPDDDGDPLEEATVERDGERTLDPDAADELVDSAEADRLASGGDRPVDEG